MTIEKKFKEPEQLVLWDFKNNDDKDRIRGLNTNGILYDDQWLGTNDDKEKDRAEEVYS